MPARLGLPIFDGLVGPCDSVETGLLAEAAGGCYRVVTGDPRASLSRERVADAVPVCMRGLSPNGAVCAHCAAGLRRGVSTKASPPG